VKLKRTAPVVSGLLPAHPMIELLLYFVARIVKTVYCRDDNIIDLQLRKQGLSIHTNKSLLLVQNLDLGRLPRLRGLHFKFSKR
jgi:hypothetical protein